MLSKCLVCACLAVPVIAMANEHWDQSITADLDKNGQQDVAKLRTTDRSVFLSIKLNSRDMPIIEVPIDGSKQFAVCPGPKLRMKLGLQSEAPLNALGEWPRGYAACPECVEIEIIGGECDPIYFYWNQADGKIDWWRE